MSKEKNLVTSVLQAIEEGIADIRTRVEQILKSYSELPAEAKAELELSPQQLDKLPWKPYREGHRSAWIFADLPEAKKLYELIKESEMGKIPLGEFEYKITRGRDREFISRNPIK